ncbi:DNA repair exonuclease SbcCD ATPase subunit [Williamsia muralis]|uniref:DNA repair exonuclease SbcCD ATPase subunit n=1 Tax=Williamsia marianensis TaxID=85044 RepID=A0A495K6J3_WILMA|nr:AAA family ATPase [Williamsia muralis]RKR96012.1 DNA repair exonuclease SbcCD ATPase subunit [Williamsia muralis]
MKLHRLRLSHFRGITEREIIFPEVGVTVVEGANEAGKSSMIEALDLLLEVRSDSKSAKVRAVAPSGLDVGSVVEADISCGPYRFTYTKQYNRGARTELVIDEPVREQLSGRAAHERVCAILDERVDAGLFKALRLLQAGDPVVGELSSSAALSRALDTAAGTTSSGTDPGSDDSALLDAVRTEYERYFTAAQGRPARELAAATADVERAQARHTELAAAMDQVTADAARLETLTTTRRELANSLEMAKVELASLTEQREQAVGLQRRHDEARTEMRSLQNELQSLDREKAQRAAACKRVNDCEHTIDVTVRAVEHVRGVADTRRVELTRLDRDMEDARLAEVRAAEEVAAARAAAKNGALRTRRDEVTALLERVGSLREQLTAARRQVAAVTSDHDDLDIAEDLAQRVTIARAESRSAAAFVTVTKLGDHAITVDGVDTATTEFALTEGAVVEVDGVVRVAVAPGAESATLAGRLAGAERALAGFLEERGVADVAELRAQVRRRERASDAVDSVRSQLAAVLGDRDEDTLRAELAELTSRIDAQPTTTPTVGVEEAERRAGAASVRLAGVTQQRAEVLSELRSLDNEHRILDERLVQLRADRDDLRDQHHQLCDGRTDEALEERRVAILEHIAQVEKAMARAARDIDEADPETLELHYANVSALVEHAEPRLAGLGTEIAELRTRIEIRRDDGQLDQLHVAATELEGAQGVLERVRVRAQAAELLLHTLQRHRDNTRRRYVQPFTDQVLRLGKVVFGSSLGVGIDEELRITTRTLDGVTVDHDALSGGAKEQLGIISRLACAMLIDPADGVPVIIDDALGYTDPERLASMGAVLGHAGRNTQVIVLTCTPQRYQGVGGAHLVAV